MAAMLAVHVLSYTHYIGLHVDGITIGIIVIECAPASRLARLYWRPGNSAGRQVGIKDDHANYQTTLAPNKF